MKKKILREVDVIVKVVESKKCFKLRVEDDIRLKTIANKLCTLMNIDPFCTEWAFFTANDDHYEVPISYTLKQVIFSGNHRILLAKIMSTTMKVDYFVETSIGCRFDSRWRRRIEKGSNLKKEIGVQTDEGDVFESTARSQEPQWYSNGFRQSIGGRSDGFTQSTIEKPKKPRVIYTMYGIEDPLKLPPKKTIVKSKPLYDIWDNLQMIEESRIMRGLNVVGYCPNEKCINYQRWINVSLGFGR